MLQSRFQLDEDTDSESCQDFLSVFPGLVGQNRTANQWTGSPSYVIGAQKKVNSFIRAAIGGGREFYRTDFQ